MQTKFVKEFVTKCTTKCIQQSCATIVYNKCDKQIVQQSVPSKCSNKV